MVSWYKYILLTLLLCSGIASFSHGHTSTEIDTLITHKVSQAKDYIDQEDYMQANYTLMEVLKTDAILPNETCFFFGKSLYHSGYHTASIKALRKYIALTDTVGEYYKEAIDLLQRQGVLMKKEIVRKAENKKQMLEERNNPCNGKEKVVCPICKGSGVVVSEGSLGKVYKVCEYGDENNMMDCDRYREFLGGNWIKYEKRR